MSQNGVAAAVTRALTRVVNPATGQDIVAGGQVADIAVDGDGRTRFVFALRKGDPGTLVRQARAAAAAVDGVSSVKVDVQLPQTPPAGPGGGAGPRVADGGSRHGGRPAGRSRSAARGRSGRGSGPASERASARLVPHRSRTGRPRRVGGSSRSLG